MSDVAYPHGPFKRFCVIDGRSCAGVGCEARGCVLRAEPDGKFQVWVSIGTEEERQADYQRRLALFEADCAQAIIK